MTFQISPLERASFAHLFSLDTDGLAAVGARWYVADEKPGFPCRVSLVDAEIGERVLLVPFEHQPATSPYRASGPIFIRESATQAGVTPNTVPALLRSRLLSVRAYSADDVMLEADVVEGPALEGTIARLFGTPAVSYLHVHFARPGCYACRVDRA